MVFKNDTHDVKVYNKSGIAIDSIEVKTCSSCLEIRLKDSNLRNKEFREFTINLKDYKLENSESFFFIKIFQGKYYITSTFNYHDNWFMSKSSSIYLYKDFIALAEMNNPEAPKDRVQRKFLIKK